MNKGNVRKLAYADAVPLGELVAACRLIEQELPLAGRSDRATAGPSPALVVTDELAALAADMELPLV